MPIAAAALLAGGIYVAGQASASAADGAEIVNPNTSQTCDADLRKSDFSEDDASQQAAADATVALVNRDCGIAIGMIEPAAGGSSVQFEVRNRTTGESSTVQSVQFPADPAAGAADAANEITLWLQKPL